VNKNPLEDFLKKFFDSLVLLQQSQSLVEASLKGSIKNFETLKEENTIMFFNALIIGDWTGPDDKGWKINYPTGSDRIIRKEDFSLEINRLISYDCCYQFSQAFEKLQSLLKDFISYQLSIDEIFCKKSGFEINNEIQFYRSINLKRDKLLKLARKIFTEDGKKVLVIIHFKEFWTVLATCRDAIVHSENIIKNKEIDNWTKYHFEVLKYVYPNAINQNNKDIHIVAERQDFSRGIIKIAEFGYQIFKQISIRHNYEWKVLKNYGVIPSEARKARENQQRQNEINI
jgi:hypothetical protein